MNTCLVWRLEREYKDDRTLGTVYDPDGNLFCYSLELPWKNNESNVSCIPEGVYNFSKAKSPTFGDCFALDAKDTAPRSSILIHAANYVNSNGKTELKGCIAPCEKLVDIDGDGTIDAQSSKSALTRWLKASDDSQYVSFILQIKKKD